MSKVNSNLLIVGVFMLMFSVSSANVELYGCLDNNNNTKIYCPGQTVSFACKPDTENITVVLKSPDGSSMFYATFSETSLIGAVQNDTIDNSQIWYNKTDDTSVRVWFTATTQFDGYLFQCKDDDDETEVASCTVNIAVPTASNFSNSAEYCEMSNFTWSLASNADTSCLQAFVVRVKKDGINTDTTVAPNITSYTTSKSDVGDSEVCLSIASRSSENVGSEQFSDPQCIKFDVPKTPASLMENYNVDDTNEDNELTVTVTWDSPDTSRPNVLSYYLWTNITDSDGDDDNNGASGSGEKPDDGDNMNEYRLILVRGNETMMKISGAKEGYYYAVKLIAANCIGNSAQANLTFRVQKEVTTTPTTPTTQPTGTTSQETPEPSSSPTLEDDPEGLATYIIVIIAVVGGLFLFFVIAIPCIILICCCCCGGLVCCAAAAGSGGSKHDIEMAKHGTHL